MRELVLVVEGDTDIPFLKYFINKLIQQQALAFELLNDASFISCGGKNKITSEVLRNIQANIFKNKIVAVIFDAETNFDDSRTDIIKQLDGTSIPIFLFPNNEKTGSLETLLSQIIPEKHQPILSCYESYTTCVSKLGLYKAISEKGKLLSYVEVTTPRHKVISLKEVTTYSNTEYWDMESSYLEPLKKFILNLK